MVSAPPPSRAHHAVAWRAPSELHHLKTLFFPPNPGPDSSDARLQALSIVRAWTVRTRLPHSIESTAILVSTILADTPSAPHLTLRLAYSSAICRFVNGLLDPAQQGQFALPMHQLARELGLDASFVEVRHAATHEELPSLCVLRRMAGRALDWLWSNYWCTIGYDEPDMDILRKGQTKEEEWMMSRAQMLVKRWRVLRKGNPGKVIKVGDQSVEAKEARAVIKDAVELGKGEGGLQALVLALLDVKALVPKGKRKDTMMDGALKLWSPLLRALDTGLDGFVNALLEAMVEIWRERTGGDGLVNGESGERNKVEANKEYNAALVFWVKHFASGEFTRGGASAIDVQELAKECVMAPNEW